VPIALTEEHEALRLTSAQRWLQTHCPPSVPRSAAESATAELPGAWEKMAAQGWLGLHLPEADGGQGFGLKSWPSCSKSSGTPSSPVPCSRPRWWPPSSPARERGPAVSLPAGTGRRHHPGRRGARGRPAAAQSPTGRTDGQRQLATGAGASTASLILAPVDEGGWCLLPRGRPIDRDPARARCHPDRSGRPWSRTWPLTGETRCPGSPATTCAIWPWSWRRPRGPAWPVGAWTPPRSTPRCACSSAAHRPVPGDQARAGRHAGGRRADGGRGLGCRGAWSRPEGIIRRTRAERAGRGALSLAAAAHCAKQCVQILGGIGFTWEHDAHFYLKRAMATRQLAGRRRVPGGRCGQPGPGRRPPRLSADLPPRSRGAPSRPATLVQEVAAQQGEAQRAALVETGLLMPHWPAPGAGDPLTRWTNW
jgi:hypothetical protein